MHKFILLSSVCILSVACQDDPLMDVRIEDANGMATITLNIPTTGKDTPDDEKIGDVRLMAFASRTAGSTADIAELQYNGLVANQKQILLPVGKSDFYISANAEFLNLSGVSNPAQLQATNLTFEKLSQSPFPMLGVYKNINIKNGEAKEDDGTIANIGSGLKRVASKLTLNIEYTSKENEYVLSIDSAKVFNRPVEVSLLPTIYNGTTYVSDAVDMKNAETESEVINSAGDTTRVYKPMTFYLSEYLLSKETMGSSTYVTIYAHTVSPTSKKVVKKEYKVYIGDWFGTMAYSDFPHDKPTDLGIIPLGVTRGKNYILNGKLHGSGELLANNTTVRVEDWNTVEIDVDITRPFLNLMDTELLVNPLNAEGTALVYITNRPFSEIGVEITNNPGNRFIVEKVAGNNEIRFKHKIEGILRLDTVVDNLRKPFTGQAKITLDTPNGKLEKNITLVAFNPLSRYYVRKNGNYDNIDKTSPQSDWLQAKWSIAKGYRSPYSGFGDGNKKGFDPNKTTMDDVASDTISGCAQYWENSTNDVDMGQGKWRLPKGTSMEGENSEIKRMQKLLSQLIVDENYYWERLQFASNIWGRDDDSDRAYLLSQTGDVITDSKTSKHYVRCVRDVEAKKAIGASYLFLSHSYYEVPLYAFKTHRIPITFESDAPVSVSLYDDLGVNISNIKNARLPFVGYVDNISVPSIPFTVFPNWYYRSYGEMFYEDNHNGHIYRDYLWDKCSERNRGDFYLEPAFLRMVSDNPIREVIGDVIGASPVELMGKTYKLIFSAGSIQKVVLVKLVNNLSDEKNSRKSSAIGNPLTYFEAHGVRQQYVGYDLQSNQEISSERNLLNYNWSSLVPDTLTGCAAYYEKSPSDPETGIGNWSPMSFFPNGITNYVSSYYWYQYSDKDSIQTTIGWEKLLGFSPQEVALGYWTTVKGNYEALVTVTDPYIKKKPDSWPIRKDDKAYVRCVRTSGKDRLQLSSQDVKFEAEETDISILYYTDSGGIEFRKLFFSNAQGRQPFEVSIDVATSVIHITRKENSSVGDKMNLLVYTKSDNPKKKQYKIISVEITN